MRHDYIYAKDYPFIHPDVCCTVIYATTDSNLDRLYSSAPSQSHTACKHAIDNKQSLNAGGGRVTYETKDNENKPMPSEGTWHQPCYMRDGG